jgi:hypothetical protein
MGGAIVRVFGVYEDITSQLTVVWKFRRRQISHLISIKGGVWNV